MQTLHTDLFPETLLVTIRNGHVETDSLRVAEQFHKLHKNILQGIETLISELEKIGGDGLNFQLISYLDSMNRERKMYRMDRLAFSVLANRFTGIKALAWQIAYHKQFEQMERQLIAKETRFAKALDMVRPSLRPVVEATERGENRSVIGASINKSANSVSYHRSKARQFGLLN